MSSFLLLLHVLFGWLYSCYIFGCCFQDLFITAPSVFVQLPYIYIYIYKQPISIMVWVFTNGPGDLGSIPGRVIPKTQKIVIDAFSLNTYPWSILYNTKWNNPGKGVAPSPTSQCSSYWKGSFWIAFNYSWPTYIYMMIICLYIYIYTHTHTHTHTHTQIVIIIMSYW